MSKPPTIQKFGVPFLLVCQGGDLLLFYLIVGEFLLVLLPVLTGRGRLPLLATDVVKGVFPRPTMMDPRV